MSQRGFRRLRRIRRCDIGVIQTGYGTVQRSHGARGIHTGIQSRHRTRRHGTARRNRIKIEPHRKRVLCADSQCESNRYRLISAEVDPSQVHGLNVTNVPGAIVGSQQPVGL